MEKIKVLIIEDDNDINLLLKSVVENIGYTAVQAYSGTEGLIHLKNEHFNLILLDLMLPGISGEELLSELRSSKTMPVIVISAKADKDSKLKALKIRRFFICKREK